MVHTLPKGVSPKVSIIERIEFEHAYSVVVSQHVGHDATESPPSETMIYMCIYPVNPELGIISSRFNKILKK